MSYKFPPSYQPAINAVASGLVEFGYPDVTAETIDKAHANWNAGREPGDIIEHFAFNDFDGHPEHFGTKDGERPTTQKRDDKG